MKKEHKHNACTALAVLAGTYAVLKIAAKVSEEDASIDADNPYLETVEKEYHEESVYQKKTKPVMDSVLSFAGLIALSPVFLAVSAAIYIDDPGSILFTQKRVGKDGHFFQIHKFRTMKMDTPHDKPTHQLDHPEQYITRVGRILRVTSLDELPQIWDIFRGKMSIVGPRPALYNQDDLIAERNRYSANTAVPGLTGLAQINGRDELEIPLKAEYDGKYTEALKKGGRSAFMMDMKCFFATIEKVLKRQGVKEGMHD